MRKIMVLIVLLAGALMPSAGLAQFGHGGHHRGGHGGFHHGGFGHGFGHASAFHGGAFHGGFAGNHGHIVRHHRHHIHLRAFRHRHYGWGYGGLALAATLGSYGPYGGPYGYGGYYAPAYRNCFLERRWVRSSHGPHRAWVRVCL